MDQVSSVDSRRARTRCDAVGSHESVRRCRVKEGGFPEKYREKTVCPKRVPVDSPMAGIDLRPYIGISAKKLTVYLSSFIIIIVGMHHGAITSMRLVEQFARLCSTTRNENADTGIMRLD